MLALVLSIGSAAGQGAAQDPVVLDPVPDNAALSGILASAFTLPLLFGIEGQSRADLDAEVAAEATRLAGLLRSFGFLEARVNLSGSATPEDPLRFAPVPGPRYKIGRIRVEGVPRDAGAALAVIGTLVSRSEGATATRAVLDELTNGIVHELREASYANAATGEIGFDFDRQSGIAGLTLRVDAGLPFRFGQVAFRGSYRVAESETMKLVPFRPGDPYSVSATDALWTALDQTGKFSRIRIEHKADPKSAGVMDLDVRLWDKAEFPDRIEALSDVGPRRLALTILMLILLESFRVTTQWSDRYIRRFLIIPTSVMLAGSAIVLAERLYRFL